MPRHCRRVMELAQKHKEELLTGKGRWDPTNRTDEQVELVESAGPAGQTTPPVLVCFASIDAAVQHAVFVTGQVSTTDVVRGSVHTRISSRHCVSILLASARTLLLHVCAC
jgi:hypothetical protein